MIVRYCWLLGLAALLCRSDFAFADEIDKHLQTIARVGPQGAGSAEARKAVEANQPKYKEVVRNRLDEPVFSSAAISGARYFSPHNLAALLY